ncbi:hypothetical protein CSA56_12175 [candidate division KSB3 bacterium]|uniref:Uncharacterized protein n=1 Tax=candidate division KSB3 bacterium TaxID=2044937 RepID=A0A2G6KCD3_9BACT|nr:MAG: hypothetical protein CSA56_12175 [candidate division KSB3 bacterium]
MDEQLSVLAQAAVSKKRQDDEALALYWEYIQSGGQADFIPQAYYLLYTAWYAQQRADSLHKLVDSACQRNFVDVEVLSFLADREFQAERYQNSLKLYDRLLTLKALDAKSYQQLKLACFKQKPFDDFINLLLQRCLHDVADDEAIVKFLFSQYLLHERFTFAPTAPPIYQAVLAREPENLNAHQALSECYYRQGKYELAIEEGETGLHYEKHHPDILATLAKAHYELKEYGKVVTCCRDALSRRPGRSDMQVLLGVVYAHNALTTTDAVKIYQAALKSDAQNLLIRLALFRAYLRKLQLNEAIEECEQIEMLLTEMYDTSHREFQRIIKEMINEYERTIRRVPEELPLYLVTAKLYEDIGHFHKALVYYRTLLELPLDSKHLQTLITLLEKLSSFEVQNPHLYLYLGLLYHKVGRHHDAKLAFRVVMYSNLDEREVDDILVRHDRSIWQYPPVLVILAHHRIVTKDILEGLIQTFQEPDREDWNGVLWVFQELYDIDDLLVELRQLIRWDNFSEVYQQIITLLVYNGSPHAIKIIYELLSHPEENIRLEALNALIQMEQPLADQCLAEASYDNPHPDIRLEITGYYSQVPTEHATDILLSMLHDEAPHIRLYAIQALQKRDVQAGNFREVLFTEQNPAVKVEIVRLLAHLQNPEEWIYLVHLLNDVVAQRVEEGKMHAGKMYNRLKQLIVHSQDDEEAELLSTLIQAAGSLRLEEGIYSLATIAEHDRSQQLRLEAIEAIGRIGSSRGITVLKNILHSSSESQEIRAVAEETLDILFKENPL